MLKNAAIVTSLISLFDTSIDYQIKICRNYCNLIHSSIKIELKEVGYIDEKVISSKRWECISHDNKIDILVFYQKKQLSVSNDHLYNFLMRKRNKSLTIYYVKDNLLFDGITPSFRHINLDSKINTRKKLKDLFVLINMNTCSDDIIKKFIYDNFETFKILMDAINCDSLWLRKALHPRKSKKNIKEKNYYYNKFVNKIKDLDNIHYVNDICTSFKNITV
ncbi:hypothetical protein [Lumpy skin disease virus]|uniref:Protein OPG061 n=1 Tax=Lumpy skin disease virus TaxID=59509 RepID=Q91MX7_LSDV|nr:hypothetical protein LSDVgp030 [Lumpy skin disease virus NI-2490]AAN02598.1 hypothetical protein [Lumpy skin disease virus NW-LW]AOE47606.1 hypothetical protein [Lumpy skin disease virus]AAK84991.1 LSDV030 hypothetical protein [Lumpy skin disease virus NI-2490]ARO77338.1 hypothetical protein [Lumpy skin disease virus]ART89356.1 hypothetical protein [Lumpy skin disease virus]